MRDGNTEETYVPRNTPREIHGDRDMHRNRDGEPQQSDTDRQKQRRDTRTEGNTRTQTQRGRRPIGRERQEERHMDTHIPHTDRPVHTGEGKADDLARNTHGEIQRHISSETHADRQKEKHSE